MCHDPTCIGARFIAEVSADLSDDPTGARGDVGARLSAHLSAEVNTYFSAETNMDGHAGCSARAPCDTQGGEALDKFRLWLRRTLPFERLEVNDPVIDTHHDFGVLDVDLKLHRAVG